MYKIKAYIQHPTMSDVGCRMLDAGFLQLGCRIFTTRMPDLHNFVVGFSLTAPQSFCSRQPDIWFHKLRETSRKTNCTTDLWPLMHAYGFACLPKFDIIYSPTLCHRHKMTIDLFSLYVLLSLFRPRNATRRNNFFQMSSYAGANVRTNNEINKGQIPMRPSRGLKWEIKTCTS